MARIAIPINDIPPNGGGLNELVFVAADQVAGHEFVNDGYTALVVKNGHTGSQIITVTSVPDTFGRTKDTVLTVPTLKMGAAGPFLQGIWNQAGAKVFVDVTDDTLVELACLRLTQVR